MVLWDRGGSFFPSGGGACFILFDGWMRGLERMRRGRTMYHGTLGKYLWSLITRSLLSPETHCAAQTNPCAPDAWGPVPCSDLLLCVTLYYFCPPTLTTGARGTTTPPGALSLIRALHNCPGGVARYLSHQVPPRHPPCLLAVYLW